MLKAEPISPEDAARPPEVLRTMATELVFCMPLKAPHHNGCFDVDEKVIPLAARIFAELVLSVSSDPIQK